MQRPTHLLLLTAAAAILASCYGPAPRPFAGRGRSLDEPPRYGDPNRYVEPVPEGPEGMVGPQVPPPNLDPSTGGTMPPVDPGLTVTPPVPGGVPTPPAGSPSTVTPPGTTPPVVTIPTTPTTPAAPSEVPFARAVPGKPGFVYSPKDPSKMISVEGLRPGQKAKDPETGVIFRVPY